MFKLICKALIVRVSGALFLTKQMSLCPTVEEFSAAAFLDGVFQVLKIAAKCLKHGLVSVEKFAVMDPIVILGKNLLNFLSCEVDSLEVMLPSEVNAKNGFVLGGAQWNHVCGHSPDLRDLDKIAEEFSL